MQLVAPRQAAASRRMGCCPGAGCRTVSCQTAGWLRWRGSRRCPHASPRGPPVVPAGHRDPGSETRQAPAGGLRPPVVHTAGAAAAVAADVDAAVAAAAAGSMMPQAAGYQAGRRCRSSGMHPGVLRRRSPPAGGGGGAPAARSCPPAAARGPRTHRRLRWGGLQQYTHNCNVSHMSKE
jgi:hypothetical protein